MTALNMCISIIVEKLNGSLIKIFFKKKTNMYTPIQFGRNR